MDGLFRKVVQHYAATYLSFVNDALLKPTAREVAEAMLYGCVQAYTSSGNPPGCLIVNNSMPCASDGIEARQDFAKARKTRLNKLRRRLQDAKASGDLPPDADPDELASYLLSLRWGMAVEAQSGASRRDLYRIADRALRAWPT